MFLWAGTRLCMCAPRPEVDVRPLITVHVAFTEPGAHVLSCCNWPTCSRDPLTLPAEGWPCRTATEPALLLCGSDDSNSGSPAWQPLSPLNHLPSRLTGAQSITGCLAHMCCLPFTRELANKCSLQRLLNQNGCS